MTLRCRYADCGYPVVEDEENDRVTCPKCRDDLGLDPTPIYPLANPPVYGDSDYLATGGKIVQMSPAEYLELCPVLTLDEESQESIGILRDHIESGRELDPPMLRYVGSRVSTHDGRHRAHASIELGIEMIPVLVFRYEPTPI